MHSKFIADFKDYEDPSDEFRDKEGTLLPLWKFSYGKFKSMEVTGLCWNSAYQDLFVATLGSCKYICVMFCTMFHFISQISRDELIYVIIPIFQMISTNITKT